MPSDFLVPDIIRRPAAAGSGCFGWPLEPQSSGRIAECSGSTNETGSATHGLDKAESDGIAFTPTQKQGIIAMSVDGFVQLPDAPFPNQIKIDVDGLEGTIVSNMKQTLADKKLRTIVIEVATSLSQGKIEKRISDAGFKIITEEIWFSPGGLIKNYLFQRIN